MGRRKKLTPATENVHHLKAVEKPDLGPTILPLPDEAVSVLGHLGLLNDQAIEAFSKWQDLAKRASTAKKAWETLAGGIQTAIKEATHPSERPLLTVAEQEDAVSAMVAGVPVHESGLPCGCDAGAGWVCEAHRKAQDGAGATNGAQAVDADAAPDVAF